MLQFLNRIMLYLVAIKVFGLFIIISPIKSANYASFQQSFIESPFMVQQHSTKIQAIVFYP